MNKEVEYGSIGRNEAGFKSKISTCHTFIVVLGLMGINQTASFHKLLSVEGFGVLRSIKKVFRNEESLKGSITTN